MRTEVLHRPRRGKRGRAQKMSPVPGRRDGARGGAREGVEGAPGPACVASQPADGDAAREPAHWAAGAVAGRRSAISVRTRKPTPTRRRAKPMTITNMDTLSAKYAVLRAVVRAVS